MKTEDKNDMLNDYSDLSYDLELISNSINKNEIIQNIISNDDLKQIIINYFDQLVATEIYNRDKINEHNLNAAYAYNML